MNGRDGQGYASPTRILALRYQGPRDKYTDVFFSSYDLLDMESRERRGDF